MKLKLLTQNLSLRLFIVVMSFTSIVNAGQDKASNNKVSDKIVSNNKLCDYYKYDYTDTAVADELIKRDSDPILFQSSNPQTPVIIHLSDLKKILI